MAIAIVAAIASVALPWTWDRLGRATLPETANRIGAMLTLARAEAMRSGRLVEVRFEPAADAEAFGAPLLGDGASRLVANYFDPDLLEESLFERPEFGLSDEDIDAGGSRDGDEVSASLTGSWSVLTLPVELGLAPQSLERRREFAAAGDDPTSPAEVFAALEDDVEEAEGDFDALPAMPRPLAIFLPDGSNVLMGTWWLEERPPDGTLPPPESDRRRRIRIDLLDAAGLARLGEVERVVPTFEGTLP